MKFRLILSLTGLIVLRSSVFAGIYHPVPYGDSLPQAGNPVIRHKYTADPAALVYHNTVYLYTGHDEAPPRREGYVMKEWLCFSSTDMVHWTEHITFRMPISFPKRQLML